ncbi:MAG TPA: DUF4215 domain-containing protein, partial [Polyangiales bacterium]|nr:DUF4215 domain-containing protein [Polyangiales bacterium]
MTTARWLCGLLATVGALAGCRAQLPDGIFSCSADGQCPSGFYCDSDSQLCRRGADPTRDDAGSLVNGQTAADASTSNSNAARSGSSASVEHVGGSSAVSAGSAALNGGSGAGRSGAGAGAPTDADSAGASGQAGGTAAADGGGTIAESCTTESTLRCAAATGQREQCTGGHWRAAMACATGQTCSDLAPNQGSCISLSDACRGSEGKTICDPQGTLIVCNSDGSAGASQPCKSLRHCQQGLASGACADCIPSSEYHCDGATLQVCAADGKSFIKQTDCATAALCNALIGMCTSATCTPNQFACQGDTLEQCNGDGTGFTSMSSCAKGMCDATGSDCNLCQPGVKSCDQRTVLTCNASGQGYDHAACAGTQTCVGAGRCVDCASDDDCSALTQGCKIGYCFPGLNACGTKNATDQTTRCASGVCSAGACVQCGLDADCSGATPYCATSTHTCAACTASAGCTTSQTCMQGKCVAKPFCGDGITQSNEECDDGNSDDSDGCVNCKNARCGDGYVRTSTETCDPGVA